MRIAALIPTLHRPLGLRRVLMSLRDTAPDVVPVVSCDPDDCMAHSIAERLGAVHVTIQEARAGCANAWNVALRAYPEADAYVIASDDCVFTPGWLETALAALEQIGGSGLVGFNAKWKTTDYAFFYLMTRDFIIKHHGGVAAVPHYKAWGVDTEACDRAMRSGKYIKAMDAVVLHDRSNPNDDTYKFGEQFHEETKRIYLEREAAGFPDDFSPIITGSRTHD